jgi:hypothetical protein
MKVETIVFNKLPEHDTCWSFIEGSDGKLYAGVCGEITGGLSAYVVSYDPAEGSSKYLLEIAAAIGCPTDNGQGTHSKIHKCLLQDDDGIIYAATHCTGPPLHDWIWRPWNCWTHPQKQFSGSGFVAMKADGELLYAKILFPKEGARCMALAQKRKKIYGLSYPRNHFFVYDLQTREVSDIGRIGNINPQCVFVDREENAYTTDDYGKIIKFVADRGELVDTGIMIPHASFRNGYHNTLYDVTPTADGKSVYGVTWTWGQRLFRFDFADQHLQDYGKAYGEEDTEWDHIIHSHVGGMVVGPDEKLYFSVNLRSPNGSRPHLVRFDPETQERELLGMIEADGIPGDHISRGAFGSDGMLYFAEAGNTPSKLFKCDVGFQPAGKSAFRRMWG